MTGFHGKAGAFSSPFTIGRVCKKLETGGLAELKIKLATKLDRLIGNEKAYINIGSRNLEPADQGSAVG